MSTRCASRASSTLFKGFDYTGAADDHAHIPMVRCRFIPCVVAFHVVRTASFDELRELNCVCCCLADVIAPCLSFRLFLQVSDAFFSLVRDWLPEERGSHELLRACTALGE